MRAEHREPGLSATFKQQVLLCEHDGGEAESWKEILHVV